MGEIGTLSGSPGDQEVTGGAINDITADFMGGGKTSVCHTGLAYCRCADASWMVTYDIDTTRHGSIVGTFAIPPSPKCKIVTNLTNLLLKI